MSRNKLKRKQDKQKKKDDLLSVLQKIKLLEAKLKKDE